MIDIIDIIVSPRSSIRDEGEDAMDVDGSVKQHAPQAASEPSSSSSSSSSVQQQRLLDADVFEDEVEDQRGGGGGGGRRRQSSGLLYEVAQQRLKDLQNELSRQKEESR